MRTAILSFVGITAIALSGCGYKYTQAVDASLRGKKLPQSTFIVYPLTGMHYSPPSGCMMPADNSEGPEYEITWNRSIFSELRRNFPNEKFILAPDAALSGERTLPKLAEGHEMSRMVSITESSEIEYMDMPRSPAIEQSLASLRDSLSADYAIVFLEPRMVGEVQTNYSAPTMGAGGMMVGGGAYRTTYYTSNVRFQVWDCRTGRLVYCSGAIKKSDGFCILVSPQQGSIDGNVGNMTERLRNIISLLLERRNNRLAKR